MYTVYTLPARLPRTTPSLLVLVLCVLYCVHTPVSYQSRGGLCHCKCPRTGHLIELCARNLADSLDEGLWVMAKSAQEQAIRRLLQLLEQPRARRSTVDDPGHTLSVPHER